MLCFSFKENGFTRSQTANYLEAWHYVKNRLATEPVMLKVHNVKLNFDIWLVLYICFMLYFWHNELSMRQRLSTIYPIHKAPHIDIGMQDVMEHFEH